MIDTQERMKQVKAAYEAIPDHHARLAATMDAVREADHSGDRSWRIRSRYDALYEHLLHGDRGKALPLAVEIITIFEEQPIRKDCIVYLNTMNVAIAQWTQLPQLPLDQLESLMGRFHQGVRYYQYYDGVYCRCAYLIARLQGKREEMEQAWRGWNKARHFNACTGCKQRFRLEYALDRMDEAMIRREAQPILDGTTPCDQEPKVSISLLLNHTLKTGDMAASDRWASRLRTELTKETPYTEYNYNYMCWLAYRDPDEGLKMMERAFPDNWQKWDQNSRFNFYLACWVLCRRLSNGDRPLLLELPREFPLWRQDGQYAAGELADWFHTKASEIAHAFDSRDGYPYFAQDLEQAGHYFD